MQHFHMYLHGTCILIQIYPDGNENLLKPEVTGAINILENSLRDLECQIGNTRCKVGKGPSEEATAIVNEILSTQKG